jgi:hypothetical protein
LDELEFAGQQVPVLVIEPTLEDVFHLDEHIQHLKKEIKKAEDEKKRIIEDHLKSNKLLEGNFKLEKKVKFIRILNVQKFREMYPKEFEEIIGSAKILTKAEEAIGKNKLIPLCTEEPQYSYSVEYIPKYERK